MRSNERLKCLNEQLIFFALFIHVLAYSLVWLNRQLGCSFEHIILSRFFEKFHVVTTSFWFFPRGEQTFYNPCGDFKLLTFSLGRQNVNAMFENEDFI